MSYPNSMNKPSPTLPGRAGSSKSYTSRVVILALEIIGIMVLRSVNHHGVAPLNLLAGADVSGSMNDTERRQSCGLLEEAIDETPSDRLHLVLWTFDHDTEVVFRGLINETRDLTVAEDEHILNTQPVKESGTYPHRVLEAMLQQAREMQQRGERCAIVILTDGEDNAPELSQPLIRQLAQLPNVCAVWIAGPEDSEPYRLRTATERRFAPFGSRLIVSGRSDTTEAFERFHELLAAAAARRS